MKNHSSKLGSLLSLFLLLLVQFAIAEKQPSSEQGNDLPNVILLFIDDLGYSDTGPFGCKDIPTPHIDRLAKEGTTLTQAYVTNPPCCPSRCSLMMGMYGQHFGKYGMSRGLAIPEDKPTLAEFLRDNGYITGQVGKWDIGSKSQGPSARGFMQVAEEPPRTAKGERYLCKTKDGKIAWLTDINGDQMIEFIGKNKDKPFFMYWSPFAVHSPNKKVPKRLTDRTTAGKDRRMLGGGIVSVDDQVGKLLDYLDKHQLREKTLIILSSDNGPNIAEGGTAEPYRGGKGKGTQQIGWTLSPSILSWPGKIPQGERFDRMACTFDFFSTIAAAAKIPAPKHLDGVDLVPYLRGDKKESPHEYVHFLNNDPNDAKHRHLVASRWKQWRLYRKNDSEPWQLFDLVKDPREENDVAKKFPEVVKNIAKHHAKWRATHAKPLKSTKFKDRSPGKVVPTGYGWVVSDGRLKPEKVSEKVAE